MPAHQSSGRIGPERLNQGAESQVATALTHTATPQVISRDNAVGFSDEVNLSPRVRLMKLIIEMWQGKMASRENQDGKPILQSGDQPQTLAIEQQHARVLVEAGGVETFTEPTSYRLKLHEAEKTEVSIQADITLRNGRQINVDLKQAMSRTLNVNLELSASEAAVYIDPLVLNFSGPVSLSAHRTTFDVNADGVEDNIATLSSNSAYLALDKNNDGIINDGSELFGALTGNGFAELSQYDDDGNGFIDAGDAVFSQLSLFRPGDHNTGLTTLRSVRSAGVEAIYTGSVDSPFRLTSAGGEDLGVIRSTGFHVGSYGVNTAQQIDLSV